jgi:hypothetical protein
MNDEELGRIVGERIDERVRTLTPRPDLEAVVTRTQRRAALQRRFLVGGIAVALLIGGVVGYAIADSADVSTRHSVVAFGDQGSRPHGESIEPKNAAAARAAIAQAFHDGLSGGVTEEVRDAAVQDPAALRPLRRAATSFGEAHGYSPEQLDGQSVLIGETTFIDPTHAVVRFTLTVPEHGAVLVDRVGYAIVENGRWKVALRTSCDLLSITGLFEECPPSS